MIPVIAAQIEYLPLPPIENSDEEYDYRVDNLILRCSNVIPRYVKIQTETDVHMEPPSEHGDRVQGSTKGSADISNRVMINMSHVRADARDVHFDFRKKSGIKMHDSGLADIHIPDRGLDVTMVVRNSGQNSQTNILEVVRVQCKLHDLKLRMRDTKHDTLYKVLSPVINTAIKRNAEKAIAEQLKRILIRLDQRVGDLQTKTQKTIQENRAKAQQKAHETKIKTQETQENVKGNLQQTHENIKSNIQSNVDSCRRDVGK